IAHQKHRWRRDAEIMDGGLKDFRVGFRVTGFTGNGHGIEQWADFQTVQNRVDTTVEIRNNAQLQAESSKLFQNFGGFWKQCPALAVAKRVVNAVEERVEVLDHSDLAEHAVYDVFPPLFLVCN